MDECDSLVTRWIDSFRLNGLKNCGLGGCFGSAGGGLGIWSVRWENKKPCPPLANRVFWKNRFPEICGYNAALFTPRASFGLLSTLPGMPFWEYHALRIKPAPSHPSPLKRTIPMARATVAVRIEMVCDCEFIEVECAGRNTRSSIVRQQVFSK